MRWLIPIFIFFSFNCIAQEVPNSVWDQVESFLEDQEGDIDLTIVVDRLEILYNHPIDINKVSYEDLQELRLLTDFQIDDLIAHRAAYGDLLRIEELQSIPSFTVDDINRLRSFVQVADANKIPVPLGRMFASSRHDLLIKWGQTLEDKSGYVSTDGNPSKYLGDKNKLQLRLRSNFEYKLRYGLILEKDEGEQLFSDTIYKGVDYLSAHIYLKDYSTLFKDVALGDFSISMGQGLIIHNGFGAGKSAWVTDIKKGGRVIRPYTSVNENGYFRGAAVTLRPIDKIEWTLFGSRVNRDGNQVVDDEDPENPDVFFSSLLTSGIHRTVSEKEDKGRLGMTSIGSSLKYVDTKFSVAVNYLGSFLEAPFIRSDATYNLYRFSGDQLNNVSVDYSWRYKNIHLFGESAASTGGGLAHVAGALVGLDKRLSMAVLFRDYDTDYASILPNAFGESTTINNEKGLYLGMELAINRRWKLRTYADVWKHPWLRATVANPSVGKEYLARLDYFVKRKLSAYVQYFYEEKLQNEKLVGEKFNVGRFQKRHKVRLHFSNKVSKTLELRNRLEYTVFENINGPTTGILLYQDFIYKSDKIPFSMTARFALFDTDNYDSRLYAFENSILYEFAIPIYYGRGFRYYFNLRYNLTSRLTTEFRWARTFKDIGNNGSGTELIDGRTRTDIKAQLRYTF